MTYVRHAIVVIGTFRTTYGGQNDGCHMRSRKCLSFRSTWFHLWFS